MAARLPSEDDNAPLAEINVTPLVDVMLVLLVIFIVLAPVVSQAISVRLPRAQGQASVPRQVVDVEVTAAGQVRVNGEVLAPDEWIDWAQDQLKYNPEAVVRLWADGAVPFDRVAQVVSAFNRAGIQKLAFATQPK